MVSNNALVQHLWVWVYCYLYTDQLLARVSRGFSGLARPKKTKLGRRYNRNRYTKRHPCLP